MTMPTSFGARLRWWRTRRGLSQLDLAGAAGTSLGRATADADRSFGSLRPECQHDRRHWHVLLGRKPDHG